MEKSARVVLLVTLFAMTGPSLCAQGRDRVPTGNPGAGAAIGGEAAVASTPEELADPPTGKLRQLDMDSVDEARVGLAKVLAAVPVGQEGQGSPWFPRLKAIQTQLDRTASSHNQTDLLATVPLLVEVFQQEDVPEFVRSAFAALANLSVCLRDTAAFHVKQHHAAVAATTLTSLVTMFRVGRGYTAEPDWEERPPPIDSAGVMILDAAAVVAQLRAGPWREASAFLGGVDDVKSYFERYETTGNGLAVLKSKYAKDQATIDAQFVVLKKWVAQQQAGAFAYKQLVEATELPAGSVDDTGQTLPKEFVAYLKDENAGHDRMVGGLSSENTSAYAALRLALGQGSVVETLWFVAGIATDAKPSEIDFIIHTGVRILIREYPRVLEKVQSEVAAPWKALSESPNPIYRLLAIGEMERVVKDRGTTVALLNARVGESDPVILIALIEKLLQIGGPEAKATLGEIAKRAHARGASEAARLANEAMGRLP